MMRKIGVIGVGQMGSGIAHVCAISGYDVCVSDVSEERLLLGSKFSCSSVTKTSQAVRKKLKPSL